MFKRRKILSILTVLGLPTICLSALVSDITRLRATILNGYDNYTRPKQNHDDPTDVELLFFVWTFRFDENRGVLTLTTEIVMEWKDEHVGWDPMDYNNLTAITFAPTDLWRPDVSVINNYGDSELVDYSSANIIYAEFDSTLYWLPRTRLQVGCNTDFRLWPYDLQTCQVFLASWSHHGAEINITARKSELLLNNFTDNREWSLARNSVKREAYQVYCCPELPNVTYIHIVITVDLERKSSAHTAAVTVVGIGIAVGVLLSFHLNPYEKERIPLTLLIMLINALYLQYLHGVIPKNGSSVPLALCFFRDSLIMVTFAFGWVVVIRYLTKLKRNSPAPLPGFVGSLLNSVGATILCLTPRPDPKSKLEKEGPEGAGEDGDVQELVDENKSMNQYQQDWEWLACLLDRIAFIAYFIVYLIFVGDFL